MAVHRPGASNSGDRVLKFRPRTLAKPPLAAGGSRGDGDGDMHHPAQGMTAPDDYRHRMTTNVAAILFTAVLTCTGIWLAIKLADLRMAQDCVLMGRRDCAHISSSTSPH